MRCTRQLRQRTNHGLYGQHLCHRLHRRNSTKLLTGLVQGLSENRRRISESDICKMVPRTQKHLRKRAGRSSSQKRSQSPSPKHLPSVSYRRRQVKGQIAVDYQKWWQGAERAGYSSLGLTAELRTLPELALPRRTLGYLLAARSQHGDFADYHERSHPGQATLGVPLRAPEVAYPSLLLQENPSSSPGSADTRP